MASPIRLLFFAAARDLAGRAELELSIGPNGTTVRDLADEVARRFPGFGANLRSIRWAVNSEYAAAGDLVRPGDEVAVIPPVAGG